MTIDERLEALTQTVEIIAGMQQETERLMQESDRRTEARIAQLTETMNRLANIVIRHEERLDQLDGGDPQ
ncbi:MAG TPA: hypothetical protein VFQ79_09185 [Bryobacteraceae bacterium]|nr:hypothetical protein [Bryobacteraceae bacterium]